MSGDARRVPLRIKQVGQNRVREDVSLPYVFCKEFEVVTVLLSTGSEQGLVGFGP